MRLIMAQSANYQTTLLFFISFPLPPKTVSLFPTPTLLPTYFPAKIHIGNPQVSTFILLLCACCCLSLFSRFPLPDCQMKRQNRNNVAGAAAFAQLFFYYFASFETKTRYFFPLSLFRMACEYQ